MTKKALVELIDNDTKTVIDTISFSSQDHKEIEWLKSLVKMGKVKFTITVKYE